MAAKRSKKAEGKEPRGKQEQPAPAPAENGHHVGEIEVHAAEEAPAAPEVRLVEVVTPDLEGDAQRGVPPDAAVREAAQPDAETPAEDEPEAEDVEGDDEHEGEPVPRAPPPAKKRRSALTDGVKNDQLADVMAHLLFHQSLIRDADKGANIQRYMELAEDFREGVHVVLDNPFDKSIAIVFELVIEERMNPWDIDLRQFSKMYLSRVHDQSAVDFIAAGKLMLMAWSILKAQTDEVITAIQRIEAQRKAEQDAALNPDAVDGAPVGEDPSWMSADETTYNFTRAVIEADPLTLSEAVHPPSERPVSLYDLIHAFEEAKEEGETRMILEEERAKARVQLEAARKAKVSGMMHTENLEEEIASTWMRILERVHKQDSPATAIPLDSLHDGSREDFLTVFISALFLSFNQRVTLRQDDLPKGPIMLQLTPQAQKGDLPPMPAPVIVTPVAVPATPRAKAPKARAPAAKGAPRKASGGGPAPAA